MYHYNRTQTSSENCRSQHNYPKHGHTKLYLKNRLIKRLKTLVCEQTWAVREVSETEVIFLARHFDFRGKHDFFFFLRQPAAAQLFTIEVSAQIDLRKSNKSTWLCAAVSTTVPTESPFPNFQCPPFRVRWCSGINYDADHNITHTRQQRRPCRGIKMSTTNTPSKLNLSVLISRRIM